MQTVQIPQTIISMLQASGRISQAGGNLQNMQGIPGGDLFAQLLQQLVGQTVCAQTQGKDAEKQGTQMAASLFAQLYPGMLAGSADFSDLSNQIQNSGQVGAMAGEAGQVPMQTLLAALQLPDAEKASNPAELFTQFIANNQTNAEDPAEMELIFGSQGQGKPSAETATSLFGGENQFSNSILAAQKMLNQVNSKKQQSEETKPIDVEQLQSDVDSGRFNTVLNVDKTLGKTPLDVQNVMEQVQTGIKENLVQGKNEFVVKLKPEGLGEITVKMVEAENKISLSIVASSPQVAKLINGELAGLRETLRPYNTDVHEVVSQSNQFYSAAQNEQFAQQDSARQFQQFSQPHAQSASLNLNEDNFEEAVSAQMMAPVSELDTYI